MSQVLQERGFGSLPSSTKTNPRDQVKSISTAKADFSRIRCIGCGPYAVSATQHRSILSETVPFLNRLQNFSCDDWIEAQDVKILDAYDHTLPPKEKDPGALLYLVLFLIFVSIKLLLTIELADRTNKQPRGIAKNVLVRIGKFIFLIDFIILDIPEDDDVPLILGRPFLSTAHSKIDVEEEKLVFKSVKSATNIIKRVFVIKSLDLETKLIGEGDESFGPTYGNYIELNDLDTPLKTKTGQDFEPTFVKINSYKMKFSCVIGYKYVNADLLPSMPINLMIKSFYYSIIKEKDERKSHAGTLIDIPVFVKKISIISGFTIIDDDEMAKDVVLGMKFCKKYASCQMIMKKFALGDKCERIMEDESRREEGKKEPYGDLAETMI
ncbi:ribonuclease H-like domain-containing protein, partial [Tanacetum coccineum]